MNIPEPSNFIEEIVYQDLQNGKFSKPVHTRFPPEPNGYLHLGHAKSICLNFGLADKYGGITNLRFDDTNPSTEETEYVNSIMEDVKWLGFEWENLFYASDHFPKLYEFAVDLIRKGLAYVDDSTPEEIAAQKGTPTTPGIESPYRNRSVEENLDLFERMKNGEFPEGSRVLRAKIDMSSPNMHMRDPIMYRIKYEPHHRTGNQWCIYPMYDFAHGLCDALEGITHSICTLEFEVHRPLYNWFIEKTGAFPSQQIEFARLNLSYTVMSKRKLLQLVQEGYVDGWDDPRMPTLSGVRRRGYPPAAIRNFAHIIGVAKRDNLIDIALLEHCVREELNKTANRYMGVFNPLKITLTNYPETIEYLQAENNPEDPSAGHRLISFSKHLFIEKDDFMENPPKKYFRLYPGGMVRLKHAYIIQCEEVIKDEQGNVIELLCKYIPESKSGSDTSGLKVKGTLHWVNALDYLTAQVHLYDRLFTDPQPDAHENKDFKEFINPNSLVTIQALIEPAVKQLKVLDTFQFLRHGYFCIDKTSTPEKIVINRTVTLKDSWSKIQSQEA
jgi:glutaminyl-tRNA synthetase